MKHLICLIFNRSEIKLTETGCVTLPVEMIAGMTAVELVLMLPPSETLDEKRLMKRDRKHHACLERAHANIITCTVCCITESWTNQLIDIIISWTGFDFNGKRAVIAVIFPVTADISSDDPIHCCWMSTTNPQWDISATAILSNTRVWDMSAHIINKKTIPATPCD